MIFCLVGKVTKIEDDFLYIEEQPSCEVHKMKWAGVSDINEAHSSTGIFYGDYSNGCYSVKRLDLRKLSTPLWEEEIVDNAISILIDLDNNPFNNLFKKYYNE